MRFLVPLYAAAAAAVVLPIIFHLIRRTPRGLVPFSSLMFLSTSPPRITRRSRLDDWWLLLLRALALILLALAFARPFFREAAYLANLDVPTRRVSILLDTSASMRRDGVWRDATAEVERALARLDPADEVALYVFDDRTRAIVEPGSTSVRHDARAAVIRQKLRELEPSWRSTDVGAALVTAAEDLAAQASDSGLEPLLQVVLISDLQRGATLDALQGFEWPRQVKLDVRCVAPRRSTNASLQVLSSEGDLTLAAARVRVTNAADSLAEQFAIDWAGPPSEPVADSQTPSPAAVHPVSRAQPMTVYVPPGQSRVVRLDQPPPGTNRLVLTGDDAAFDDTLFVVPRAQQQVTVAYVGQDAVDDTRGLAFYLRLAWAETPVRKVTLLPRGPGDAISWSADLPPRLVVIAAPVAAAQRDEIARYLESGGTVLAVLKDEETVASLADYVQAIEEPAGGARTAARADAYTLLAEVDFSHPLFAPLGNPRYNDFTKIHFWKHRRVAPQNSAARVLARFEDRTPAVWHETRGKGQLLVFTSGWHPDDSQWALSSKFVPLVSAVLDQAGVPEAELPPVSVGEPVSLPSDATAAGANIRTPAGKVVQLKSGDDTFRDTDQPGVYQILPVPADPSADGSDPPAQPSASRPFVVNLPAIESDTAIRDVEQLEQLGVVLGTQATRAELIERQRQKRDAELENQQKIWRWALLLVLALLIVETALAGLRHGTSDSHAPTTPAAT